MEARWLTVGPVQENSFLVRRDGCDRALLVDPGDEAPKLLGAIEALGVQLDAILRTHTHFDHVGAVAPVANATGAPVYCPQLEVPVGQLACDQPCAPHPECRPQVRVGGRQIRRSLALVVLELQELHRLRALWECDVVECLDLDQER